ncbi:MAG: 50S ribosomal protein L18 [Chloroflexi bacterium]|nr:50S ribosomal protein L18 [Chloroflexota bacterium]
MARAVTRREKREVRHLRVRRRVRGVTDKPRLSVFRSLRQIYAQVIDDATGRTLAASSSLGSKEAGKTNGRPKKVEVARIVGEEIARRAKASGVTKVVFDRGGYKYHGRVKALAEAARKGGLEF